MKSRAKFLGRAIHPMLIVFPLGLLSTSLFFDIAYLFYPDVSLASAAFWAITAGLIGGLAAAVFGFWDWMAIPQNTRARRVGLLHGGGNVIVVVLFAISWIIRWYDLLHRPNAFAIILSFLGVALALITGWLGGELVERLGVGVDPGAHLNAPSSLHTDAPAEEGDVAVETTRATRRVA